MKLSPFFLSLLISAKALASPRPALPRPSLMAPILVESAPREQAWVFPGKTDAEFLVEAEPLIASLAEDLPAEKISALRARIATPGVLSLQSLREEGFDASFSELTLELSIRLRPEAKRIVSKSLVQRGVVPSGKVQAPSPLSAILNARANQPFQYPENSQGSSRMPLSANFDFALNAKGWVLETGQSYTERDPYPWKREDTALVHDWEESMLRLRAGDQQTLASSYFLTSRPIGGVGLSRVFAIQPHLTTQPVSRTELLLKRPSVVEVLVNGTMQSQLRLPAGPVNIQDFPLASGFNNVLLRITDDLGRTEIVDLNLFYNSELLGKGIQQFSYQAGALSTPQGSGRRYDENNWNFSAQHRAGLSDTFTGGLFGQTDRNQGVFGVESLWVEKLGSLTLNLAGGKAKNFAADGAGRLRYETLDGTQGRINPWRHSLESEFRGRNFALVGNPIPLNPYSWSLSSYSLFRSQQGLDLGGGLTYRFRRSALTDRWEGRADVSSQLAREWRLSLNYGYAHDTAREHRVYASLTWVESAGRHYVNASYDYPSHTTRVEAVRNPEQAFDDIRLSAGAARSPENQSASLQAEYYAQRAVLRLDHQSNFPLTGNRATRHVSSAGLGTALVWAGSSVSLSRPVPDSFVILPARGAASGKEIAVNPQGTSAETYSGGLLPGVLPNVTSYYYTPVSVDGSALPPGISFPEEYFMVKNTYRSGTVIPLAADLAAAAQGVLRWNEQPLEMVSGEVLLDSAESGPVFFTNKRGQFVTESLRPGKYRLRFFDGVYQDVPFEIPNGAFGIVRLGEIHVQKGGGK